MEATKDVWAMTATDAKPRLLCICSSQITYLSEIELCFHPWIERGQLELRHSLNVPPGEEQEAWLEESLRSAALVIWLVSVDTCPTFISGRFEPLMRRALSQQRVLPILAGAIDLEVSPLRDVTFLNPYCEVVVKGQARIEPQSVNAMTKPERERLWFALLQAVRRRLSLPEATPATAAGERPRRSYIPLVRNPLFQERPGEFDRLAALLDERWPACVGLVGTAGSGKSQLAAHFAYSAEKRFPGGVFWVTVSEQRDEEPLLTWQRGFANLARALNYRPDASTDDEVTLAAHMAYYFAEHDDVLLILDNVADPRHVRDLPVQLTGHDWRCAVLYTSLNTQALDGVTLYRVPALSLASACRLLLPETYHAVLERLEAGRADEETRAAEMICRFLRHCPLILDALRRLLRSEPDLTLQTLADLLRQRGILDLTGDAPGVPALQRTFRLLWEKVASEHARRLLWLVACYPRDEPLPLWLLGLAANLDDGGPLSPLRQACSHLAALGLVDPLSEARLVQVHPLTRQFCRALIEEEHLAVGEAWRREAGEHLVERLADLALLEERARGDYWTSLGDLRIALVFCEALTGQPPKQLLLLIACLEHECQLLTAHDLWPVRLPALFQQQLYNRAVEMRRTLPPPALEQPWLCLQRPSARSTGMAEPAHIFRPFAAEVAGVAFIPADAGNQRAEDRVLVGARSGEVSIFTIAGARELAALNDQKQDVTALAVSHDGRRLVTGASDGRLRLWRRAHPQDDEQRERGGQPELLMTLAGQSAEVTALAFSPDGAQILSGGRDGLFCLWEAATGRLLLTRSMRAGEIVSVAFTADSRQLLVVAFYAIGLWDSADGTLVQRLTYAPQARLDFARRRVLFFYTDPASSREEEATGSLPPGVRRAILCAACSPDGRRVLAGFNDGTARLWDLASGALLTTLVTSMGRVSALCFTPDGEQALTASEDGWLRLWDLTSGHLLSALSVEVIITHLACSLDGKQVLAGCNDSRARLWSFASLRAPSAAAPIRTALFLRLNLGEPSLRFLTGAGDGRLWLWRLDSPGVEMPGGQSGHAQITALAAPVELATWLAAGLSDDRVQVYAVRKEPDGTHHLRRALLLERHEEPVTALACADHTQLFSAGRDGRVCLWKIRPYEERKQQHPTRILQAPAPVTALAVDAGERRLLAGLKDGRLVLWASPTQRTQCSAWQAHRHEVVAVGFTPDGLLLSSGIDGRTRLWDQEGQLLEELSDLPQEVTLFSYAPDGRLLLLGERRGRQLWLYRYITSQERVSGQSRLRLCAATSCTYRPLAAWWQTPRRVIVADSGGSEMRPHFYYLEVRNGPPC